MLQRAASNAYSWWWASHIRTKQSKWLEQNLQDMEEKVKFMLKLIEEDGDSFAKRAEMYFRRRPELIKFVEESYRAYRALAERYDHISGELQSANNTIATVFPEQVQFAIDDEEDHDISQRMSSNPLDQPSLPKDLPEPPKAQMLKVLSIKKKEREREGLITLLKKKANSMNIISSNLSKPEALEEIDKLQKEILALQTEKEFVKSSYESRLAKYWEIGKRITEVQEKVCNLQDEFSLSTVIEDDEARTLMASTALESCRNTLTQLQEKQERLSEEAKLENRRINIAHEKLEAFKDEFLPKQIEQWNPFVGEDDFVATDTNLKFSESLEDGRFESEMKTNGNLKIDPEASLTAIEMAEKINELVAEVISLESVVSSQTGLMKRLRLEMDELQAQLQSFEDDKGIKMDCKRMREKLEELDKKLEQVQNLNKNIDQQNNNTRSQFTEAHSNIDRLSEKLQSMKYLDEEIEVMAPKQEVGEILSQIIEHEDQEDLMIAPSYDLENIKEQGLVEERISTNLDDLADDNQELNPFNDVSEQSSFQKENNWIDFDQEDELKEEDQPDWKQLFLNGLEDRERTLLGEYTSTLRSYKETKKRLSELEKKNQDSLFEATMQVRELKGSNAMKDEEIRSLRQKLNLLESTSNENNSRTELEYQDIKATGRPNESSSEEVSKVVNGEEEKGKRNDKEFNMMLIDERQILSSTEEKFRRDIDESLEENLEFWLRFSTSFHHIQKFQTVIQDLQSDFLKLKANKKQAESNSNTSSIEQSLKSEARPIYVHLREIQTELDIWLEESVSLKEELQFRFSSLCNVQEEISRALRASSETEDMEFTTYQAAKFQGEVLNMQQENNKVANELQTGLDHVRGLQFEIDKTLSKMNQDFKLSESKKHHPDTKHSISRARIPLRSFIFGVKSLKQKPTIFSCMNPALQKNYSDLKGHIPI